MAAWAMSTFSVLAVSVAIVGRVLSPTLVLDLVALWPLLVPVIPSLVTVLVRPQSRWAGMAPMFVLTWLFTGLTLHLSGSGVVPSAAADVVSSVVSDDPTARLVLEAAQGEVTLGAGTGLKVRMDRTGGRLGAAVVELIGVEPTIVSVAGGSEEGWFRFGGMTVTLPDFPAWTLQVSAPVVDLDVQGLTVSEMAVSARGGWIRLGPVTSPASLVVSGPLRIEIPEDVPATVEGSAAVPPSWVAAAGGLRAPPGGVGWTITVEEGAGTVAISHP